MTRKRWRSGCVMTWSPWCQVPDSGSTSIPELGRAMARATSAGRPRCCCTSWPSGQQRASSQTRVPVAAHRRSAAGKSLTVVLLVH